MYEVRDDEQTRKIMSSKIQIQGESKRSLYFVKKVFLCEQN